MPLWGTRAGLEEVPLTVRLEAGVSASPMVKLIGPVDAPCTMVLFGMSDMTGGELPDDLTVRTNVVLDASEPSLTLTVTVAVPNLSAAGVAVTVRLDPLPPKSRLLSGKSVGFDDEPVTRRLSALVSASLMVKGIGSVDEFSVMVWSGMLEMEGG